jgi:hypothetical protein
MHTLAPALLLLLAASAAAAQTVHRCTDDQGQAVFQQAPCPAGTGDVVALAPLNSFPPFPALLDRMARNDSGQVTVDDMRRQLGTPLVTNTDIVDGVVTQQHVYRYADGSRRLVYTRDGEVVAAQIRPAVHRRPTSPCYGRQQIANARTSASSITLNDEQRQAALDRVRDMETCRR